MSMLVKKRKIEFIDDEIKMKKGDGQENDTA